MSDLGLTLNAAKCKFGMSSISYVGYDISDKGISVTDKKVKSIVEARVPRDVTELRSFLGLVNFVGNFIPDLSTHAEPLLKLIRNPSTRKSTKKSAKKVRKAPMFLWGSEQNAAFLKIKSMMANSETLAYFDPNANTTVTVDASPYGLGAVLSQEVGGCERVVAYGHRSLTAVERRYSQTEREALAIVWGCEHFAIYLVGMKFKLVTDHKP